MKIESTLGKQTYTADTEQGIDISIPLGKAEEVSAYGLPSSEITIFQAGGFVGDVNQGGSCNVRDIKLSPHGNGTHTECVGHISKEYKTVYETLNSFWFDSLLITVDAKESISTEQLDILKEKESTKALIIRTLPNTESKLSNNYLGANAPYISEDAMRLIVQHGIEHLLVDLPSVDHETDPDLKSHHIFWEQDLKGDPKKTITELIYVPNHVKDGYYLLNLMVPSIYCDAVPSKPIIYPLR